MADHHFPYTFAYYYESQGPNSLEISGRSFVEAEEAWKAAVDWATICWANGEAVFIRLWVRPI